MISIIIPVFREQDLINKVIEHIRESPGGSDVEIVVVDGSPGSETLGVVNDAAVKRITANTGRGLQMNRGAEVAAGKILLFLHADTKLPREWHRHVCSLMEHPALSAGAFDLAISAEGGAYRIIERGATLRSRLTKIPYGDQAVFMRRKYFQELGGYREIPIMEDLELMRRIKKTGGRVGFIRERVITSARRWEKEGVLRCTCRNWTLLLLYFLGVSPHRLARWYPS